MVARYFETRRRVHLTADNIAADVMRHLHARQHLGKALIVCDEPTAMLQLARKQWLKLSRTLQRRRTATFDANDILRYTYTITHMQQMDFVAAPPLEQPEAAAHFIRSNQLRYLPPNCLTVYLAQPLGESTLAELVSALPPSSLIVDYYDQLQSGDFGLRPRAELEASLAQRWRSVENFLAEYDIELAQLASHSPEAYAAMDDALDTLLGTGLDFIHLARSFQHTLDLARPLRTVTKADRDRFDLFVLLAHRVQTLTPGVSPVQFLKTYADDSFFLHDRRHSLSLAETILRHEQAGRHRLARALWQLHQRHEAQSPLPVSWLEQPQLLRANLYN